MKKVSKKGALQVTRDMDRLAGLIQTQNKALGIPDHIASDFVRRLDMLSDHIERTAGFDPEDIGEETGGPLHGSPHLNGEFTQEEFSAVHDTVK